MRTLLMLGLAIGLGLSVACSHNEEKAAESAPATTAPAASEPTAPAMTTPDTLHESTPAATEVKPAKKGKKSKKAQ